MIQVRVPSAVFLLLVVSAGGFPLDAAHATACEAIVGRWSWFTRGVVTFRRDGTVTHEPGNEGTWECTNSAQGEVTLRWRVGGYVNRMVLSPDGRGLTSADTNQAYVTARRLDEGPAPVQSDADRTDPAAFPALRVATDHHGSMARDLPELTQAATVLARQWREDAIPVALEFELRDAPNPRMRGPTVRVSYVSPADGTGLFVIVTAEEVRTFEARQKVTWGTIGLPPVFLDLPAAVRIAREHGVTGDVRRASLRTWSPPGAPPILAWMVGDRTVNGASGEIIDFDVTGYIERYNEQWELAARRLRALRRGPRRVSSSGGDIVIGGDAGSPGTGSDAPYDSGSAEREQRERDAAEARAYWSEDPDAYQRVKSGQCTWSDSSNYGC